MITDIAGFIVCFLSVLDVMVKKPITSLVKTSHLVTGPFSIILLGTVGVAVLLVHETPDLLWFSPFGVVIVLLYLAAMRGIFLHEKAKPSEDKMDSAKNVKALTRAISIYSIHAVVVIAAALFLPYFGENIAQKTGMSDSFFGTLFLAITTSLPELVISVSALKIGALDMAMGNLFGSNVFNIFVLAINDFFYTEGPLYKAISDTHLLSTLISIIMTAVVAIGLVTRPEKKIWRLSQDTLIVLILYMLLMIILFLKT